MANRTVVTIGGVDVTTYIINYEVIDEMDDKFSTADIELETTVEDVITLTEEMEVIIKRYNEGTVLTTIFRGIVSNISQKLPQYVVQCKDKLWLLSKKLLNYTYDKNVDSEAGNISKIALDLITTRGGLNATFGTTIQDSGDIFTLEKFVCRKASILERLKVLADALNWQLYYNPQDDNVYFEPKGYPEFTGFTLTHGGTNNNVYNNLNWSENREDIINQVEVVGQPQEIETTETFDGDTSTTEFTLTKSPVSVKVYVDDVLQVGGVTSSTTSFDYTVDPVNNKIVFEAGSTPGTGTDNVEVRYSYLEPINVTRKDTNSITTYGLYEIRRVYKDVLTVEDAISRSDKILSVHKNPISSANDVQILGIYNIKAGQKIEVNDLINSKSGDYIITRVKYSYPEVTDEISLVSNVMDLDDAFLSIAFRVKRLEDESLKDSELVTQVEDVASSYIYKSQYVEVQTRSIGTAFILGHPVNAVLGTSTLGEGTYGTLTTTAVVHPDNRYIEDFDTNDFEDTGNTTADWNTTTTSCNFSSGEIMQTESIVKGTGTINSAVLTVAFSGTFNFVITADGGSNWESVGLTNATQGSHTFTNTGTDMKFKATESGASTGTITSINIRAGI